MNALLRVPYKLTAQIGAAVLDIAGEKLVDREGDRALYLCAGHQLEGGGEGKQPLAPHILYHHGLRNIDLLRKPLLGPSGGSEDGLQIVGGVPGVLGEIRGFARGHAGFGTVVGFPFSHTNHLLFLQDTMRISLCQAHNSFFEHFFAGSRSFSFLRHRRFFQ